MKRLGLFIAALTVISSSAFAAPATGYLRQSPHQYNVRINPLGALIGMVDLAVDYKINENMTVGPTLTFINVGLNDVTVKGGGFGAEANYFFSGVYLDGFYADAGLNTLTIEASARSRYTGETASAKGTALNYFVGAGYAWFWESFNLNLGLNVGGTTLNRIEVKDSTGSTVESYRGNVTTGLDFKIGYAF